jgi:hypothetical protein
MLDSRLQKTWKLDRENFKDTKVPIITVSGTYREDLKGLYDLQEEDLTRDLVFSRAHFSMAIAVAVEAWNGAIDPKEAWLIDPTNYVTGESWASVMLTEHLGRLVARFSSLRFLKSLVDKYARRSIPLLMSVSPPLLEAVQGVKTPILSFHITAGNLLLENNHSVVEMVTDPHVREEYLANSEKPNAFYLVFDQKTKIEFLEKAHKQEKKVDEKRVIVTGPPIDPRILACREHKTAWNSNRPLRLCLTTGGLGTNKQEIQKVVDQLLPALSAEKPKVELIVYAGTHADIKNMVVEQARKAKVRYETITPPDPAQFELGKKMMVAKPKAIEVTVPLTIIYHPQIIDANELLIAMAFPWADGFISKPSGDMAYDAVASGAFLLTLKEWGEWESNIFAKFTTHKIAKAAETDDIVAQIERLTRIDNGTCWITEAMKRARTIEKVDPLFHSGAKNILKAFEKIKKLT